jgi:hypothetical protein
MIGHQPARKISRLQQFSIVYLVAPPFLTVP